MDETQPLEDWQIRCIEELAQLTDRLSKLTAALGGEIALTQPGYQVSIMEDQAKAMLDYQGALRARIRVFMGTS